MSQENVETVRRFYAFWQDRDYSAIADLVHPDAIVDISRNVFNPGVHRGLAGLRHVVEQTDEMWEDFRISPVEIIDAGDSVFVANRISGKGRGSGVEAEMLIFGVCEFREGKVVRFTGGLRDRSEALEVAGLRE
ncbi:MAG TPA: nuclear transport factor 2 family protein [Solirubrobacterales bacterium]